MIVIVAALHLQQWAYIWNYILTCIMPLQAKSKTRELRRKSFKHMTC